MTKKFLSAATFIVLWSPLLVQAAENRVVLSVRHDHFIGSGSGQLSIGEERITYDSKDDKEHFREWSYTDIRQLKVHSTTRLEILTYEDIWWKLGRDHRFKFQVVDARITPELVQTLRHRISTTVVSAVFSEPQNIFHTIPAKHHHSLGGGCDGQLLFDERGVYYRSSHREHSRFWPPNVIESVGRQSNFDFRITVREVNLLGDAQNFQFQLKRPINQDAYEQLRRKVYEPESWVSDIKLDEQD